MMMVHYGTLAPRNQVIKNAAIQEELSNDLGRKILCVKMEAAGLMDNSPCIVIRSIWGREDNSHCNRHR